MELVLNKRMYDQARKDRITFSQVLEQNDPSADGATLDAYERQLKRFGIVTQPVYEKRIEASTLEAFYRTEESELLFPEYVARSVRSAYMSYAPLQALIGERTTTDSDAVKSYYIDKPAPAKTRMKRVTEAAELPRSTIKTREQSVRFYKYGQAIEASYEVLRRMKLNILQRHIDFITLQAAQDKVEEIITVAVNGDGNSNQATVTTISSLGGSANTLDSTSWLKWLMLFTIFPCDTLVATKDAFVKIMLASFPNLSVTEIVGMMANSNMQGVRLTAPQMPQLNQTLLWHDDISGVLDGLKVLGINRQNCIEELTEAGSDITEADKFITRQTSVLTISENSGYSKMFKEATAVLNIGA